MDRSRSGAPDASAEEAAGGPTRLARFARWARPVATVLLLAFAAFVVLGNVIPTRRELAATERRLREQEAENARLRRRVAALDAEAERLRTDPWHTERILRDELRMSQEDEILVR